MVKSLKSRGWTITFIGCERAEEAPEAEDYQRVVEGLVDEFLLVKLQAAYGSRKILLNLAQYYSKLRQILDKLKEPDLVILTHIAMLPLTIKFSCKTIYDSFEMYPLKMASYFGPLEKIVRPVFLKLEGLFAKQVDGIITVDSKSKWLEIHFKQWNNNVEVIWNLPSLQEEPETSEVEALRETYGGRLVVSLVGTLFKAHGLRIALEAAALVKERHPDCLFLFIGSMQDDTNLVNQIISSRRLADHVLFLPFLPYRKMLAHLRHAKVGLNLHQPEWNNPYCGPASGRKAFTYMQAGIPMIAPNFGEIGSIICKEHCGILLDVTQPYEVSQGIMYLLTNNEAAKAMGQRGREVFLGKYNWEIQENKFLNFIDKIINDA